MTGFSFYNCLKTETNKVLTMYSCIDRLIACGYTAYEAATICQMLIKEGGDKNLYSYVAEAENVAVLQS